MAVQALVKERPKHERLPAPNNLPHHLHQPNDAKDQEANPEVSPDSETSEIVPPDVKEGEVGHDPQLDKALELLKNGQVQKTTIAQRTE